MDLVEGVMTTDMVTVDPQLSLREAFEVLQARQITGAPVVSGQVVVGVVSAADILEFAATAHGNSSTLRPSRDWGDLDAAETWGGTDENPSPFFIELWSESGEDLTTRFDDADSPGWDLLSDWIVGDVMTRRVVATSPKAPLHEAARVMLDAGVHRVLVMEDGNLRGILSATDFVRAVAARRA